MSVCSLFENVTFIGTNGSLAGRRVRRTRVA